MGCREISIEQLKKQITKRKAEIAKIEERKKLEKELFNLKHSKKIAAFEKVKGTAKHMGKNLGAMMKDTKKKKKKKSTSILGGGFGDFKTNW